MEPISTPHNLRTSREKDKDTSSSGNEKANHGGDEKGVKTSRTTRYKDKFTALRDKYEHIIMQQQNYHRDLENANAKMKKMQEEIDLLLEALMPTTPPAPSTSYFDRPTENHGRLHDMNSETQTESLSQVASREPAAIRDNLRSTRPQANGKTNGNITNGAQRYSAESELEPTSLYLPRESIGRIPIL
ncbi:hypothetical protein EV368DRAFT_65392 [Lentinula lateritia]|nr:hypothetical protein EV368DRAFT_65392 [Lentinula lateritia]